MLSRIVNLITETAYVHALFPSILDSNFNKVIWLPSVSFSHLVNEENNILSIVSIKLNELIYLR